MGLPVLYKAVYNSTSISPRFPTGSPAYCKVLLWAVSSARFSLCPAKDTWWPDLAMVLFGGGLPGLWARSLRAQALVSREDALQRERLSREPLVFLVCLWPAPMSHMLEKLGVR